MNGYTKRVGELVLTLVTLCLFALAVKVRGEDQALAGQAATAATSAGAALIVLATRKE